MDRHENIGFGEIGEEALRKIVWHPKFNGIIKLLETPRGKKGEIAGNTKKTGEEYKEEIKNLKNSDLL